MFKVVKPCSRVVLIQVPPKQKKETETLSLPCEISVRLVSVILSTGEVEVLVTSLIEEEKFPLSIFSELYHFRWGVETFFLLVKSRLALENFTGKSVESVKQDIFSSLLITNLESILVKDVEKEVNVHLEEDRLPKEIKKTVSFNSIKNMALEILTNQTLDDEVIEKLETLFKTGVQVVRKDRFHPRGNISDTRSLNFQKRGRKYVF